MPIDRMEPRTADMATLDDTSPAPERPLWQKVRDAEARPGKGFADSSNHRQG